MSSGQKSKVSSTNSNKTLSLPKVAAKSTANNTKPATSSPSKPSGKLPSISNKTESSTEQQQACNKTADAVLGEPSNALDAAENTVEIPLASIPTGAAASEDTKPEAVDRRVENVDVINESANTDHTSNAEPSGSATNSDPQPADPPVLPVNRDGNVRLLYEQYAELFPIVNGSISQEQIDEVYCLSFVMPNCLIHLSHHNPSTKRQLEIDGKFDELFLPEIPRGVFQNLVANNDYYVYVEQEAAQLERDQAMMRQRMQADPKNAEALSKDDGRVMESCSCIYGNPCVDEYGCRDWGNRFAIATKNGWKGF